jgi:hypothetical protein
MYVANGTSKMTDSDSIPPRLADKGLLMPKCVEVSLFNKLGINSASSWLLYTYYPPVCSVLLLNVNSPYKTCYLHVFCDVLQQVGDIPTPLTL